MSFADEYLELRKKRKKEEEAKAGSTEVKKPLYVNKTAPLYTDLNAKSYYAPRDEEEDIAPVKRTYFQKGALEEGVSADSVAKTILGSGADLFENLGTGIMRMGESVVDALAYLSPGISVSQQAEYNPNFRFDIDEYNKEKEQAAKFIKKDLYDEEKIAKKIISDPLLGIGVNVDEDSVFGDKTDSLAQSGGQLLGQTALQAVGVPWWVTAGATSFGSKAESVLNDDGGYEDAGVSAAVTAGAEVIFEKLFGGISFGGKTLDRALTQRIARGVSNKTLRTLTRLGFDATGEGVEEVLSGVMSAVGDKLTYADDKELNELFSSEEAWESFIGGAVLGGGSSAISGIKGKLSGVDYTTELTKNEQKVIDKVYKDKVAEAEKNGKVTQRQKDKIYEGVLRDMERGYIDTDTIEEVLGGDSYKTYKDTIDSEDALAKEYEELGKLKEPTLAERTRFNELHEQMKSKDDSKRKQLKSKLGEEVFGMVKGDRLVESYNERIRMSQDFTADLDKYKGTKHEDAARKTIESAIKAGANNSNRVHDLVDLAAQTSADTGIAFEFKSGDQIKEEFIARQTKAIAELQNVQNRTEEQNKKLVRMKEILEEVRSGKKTVNGDITANGITLNLDSHKPLNTIVGHEVTHSLENTESYQKLKDALFAYAKTKNVDVDGRLAELSATYEGVKDADPEGELLADLVGDYLFTDTDFINNLSTADRNLFQKIWDEVKYLCKVVTAGSKEARELERVKKAFEDAYRQGGKAKTDTKYSVSDSSGKQLTKGQQEYFKDSKVRDENGNLKVMYHGSRDAGFHVFDASMSDDNISLFFVDRNDVAASYSGTEETYEAKSFNTAEDANKFFAEIGRTEYRVVENDGEYTLYDDGGEVATSTSLAEIYEEFCDYEGVGYGNANYKVYLNLKNPLVVDAKDRNWNRINQEFSQEVYDRYKSLTAEEKDALADLAGWEDFGTFRSEWEEAGYDTDLDNPLVSARETLEGVDVYDLFSIASEGFSEEALKENANAWLKTRDYAKRAKEQGYDGVIFNNIHDNGGYSNGSEGASTVAIAFDSNQIKSVANENPTADPDIRYSFSSIANSFFGDENMSANEFTKRDYHETEFYQNYVESCLKNYEQTRKDFDADVAREEIKAAIDGIVRVAVASKRAGYDILDDKTKRNKKDSKNRLLFSALEPNSEYFTSNDISTICDKRKNFADIYDDIVRAEEAKGVPHGKRFFDNVDNYFYLHKLMADKGLTQPCRQCYVESMRKNLAPMASAFLRLVKETDPNNLLNDQLYQQKGKNKGAPKTNNASLRERVLETLSEYDMTVGDLSVEMLTTEDGLAELKIRAPLIYEAFNSFYGQSKPKMPKSATPFRFGELTALLTDEHGKIKKSLVDKINSTGGFRFQSYSDFQIQNFTDTLQVLFEAGTLGLSGHSYTKVPAFLDATEGTNLKRNISIFMYKDGDEWKLDRNDSFPYSLEEIYDIVNADKSGNTGIIAVSQNEDMSSWIMANDYVGYGIPFHKSGNKMGTVRDTIVREDGREIKGYKGTKDHTKQQTEVWAKASDDHKALTKVKKGINIYRFWDFDNKSNLSKTELIEKNVKAYIDACNEAGYLPKFREYVMNNGKVLNKVLEYSKKLGFVSEDATIEDISFEYSGYRIPYGYYKFLGDFGMFTPDGNASPHEVLSLKNYDFDKAVQFFSDSETLRRNEILQQFANGEERQRYRDSNLTTEELQDIVKRKRGEIVEGIVGAKNSLSNADEQYAPTGNFNVYGKDFVKRDAPAMESVAPVAENATTTPVAADDDISPYDRDRINSLTDADAPPVRRKTPPKETAPKESKPKETTTRKELHRGIVDDIKSRFKAKGLDFDKVLKNAKNLSTFATVDNTPQRVMEKALGYKEGQILSDITVNQVAQNETEGIKWLNSFTDRKNGVLAHLSKQYHIKAGSKESAAAQMYAEGFYVDENNEIIEYGDAELAKDFPNAQVQENIKGLARDPLIRQIYDDTLAMINESRTRNAYPEIPRLDNYFLHFRAMEDTFSRLGLPFNPNDIRAKDLPTDLNGVTADLKPGQPYFASAMHRTGKRTSFDLLGGMERYLSSAKNQIYHIDDIQTLRALRNYIADTYGQAKGLENIDEMSEEEAQERIKEVYGAHLSTFAKFLNEEANILAGKTALIDRGLEGIIGRRGITFLDTVNKQVGSNMVGFNLSSSLTNFLPVAQTFAKTSKRDFVKAFAQTVSNKIGSIFGKTDSFAEDSPLVIRRNGADRFYRTPYQKVGDVGYVFLGAVDSISTELIARTKYNELVRKGMDSQKAHYETDKWVSRLMGDRSLGQMPQLYNSKMLGLFTKFQLEVRNQLDSQFYDTIQEAKVSNEEIENGLARNAKTAAKVTSTFVQLAVAQHLFGKAFESVAGYNPAFDIIEVLATTLGFDDDEESEDTALDNIEQGFLAMLEDLPYTSTLTGGRIPISSALPIEELVTGTDEWGNDKSRLKTLGEIAPYYVLPGGYGQIKKTKQGLGMFSDEHPIAGSYTDSGNLRFPVEDTIGNRVKAGIFGQYANANARDYFDNERDPLKEKQIQEFIDVEMPIQDYWDYRDGLKKQEELEDKFEYVNDLDLPVAKKNILINNIVDRKDPVDMTRYDEMSGYEEFDFYSKNKEKYEFLQRNGVSYAEYKSSEDAKEEYDGVYSWWKNNPKKVTVAKAVTDNVIEYKRYTNHLNDIRGVDNNGDGRSDSGTAKAKKTAYINGLDLDYGQKIILYRSLFSSKADKQKYNGQIVSYLNSRDDISYDEMVTILEELDMKVDSNGNISW